MAVLTANSALITDGDAAFIRVDNRRPVHALEPGVVAKSVNQIFDKGEARPRLGVSQDAWGVPRTGNLAAGLFWTAQGASVSAYVEVTGLVVGSVYRLHFRSASMMSTGTISAGGIHPTADIVYTIGADPVDSAGGTLVSKVYTFTATTTTIYLFGAFITSAVSPVPVDAVLKLKRAKTMGYKRFSDPYTNTDQTVLLTDEIRDAGGEDGGIGRAWRIRSGNTPQEIALNGHDIWGECRLIQCHHSLVLLRHGRERHYFVAGDFNLAGDYITLHCAASWFVAANDAKRVLFVKLTDGASVTGTNPPITGMNYYAKWTGTSNRIMLYADSALTQLKDFSAVTASSRWYIELDETVPPLQGNGAPVLILQPNATDNAFDVGFVAAPKNVAITDSNSTSELITAPNHRLTAGDIVTCTMSTDTFTAKYAYPRSDHTFVLYATLAEALADTGTKENVTAGSQTGSFTKASQASAFIPPGREGVYYKGRLIIINGIDNIYISDPYDFLHFTVFNASFKANLGESGSANWLLPLGDDTLLIGKEQAVLAITGLSGASSGWKMEEVTREYGGIAALAAINVGTDVWLLSRKGVASIVRTVAGERLGVVKTISQSIPEDLKDVDWYRASQSSFEIWNNRFFWAAPLKDQDDPDNPENNRLFVNNFLNEYLSLEQDEIAGQIVGRLIDRSDPVSGDAWEGYWEGDLINVYAMARLKVNGEERLTYADHDGSVFWFNDGWNDIESEISTELTTRGYFRGRQVLALKGAIAWNTFRPSLSVTAKAAGYKETQSLITSETYDASEYVIDGQSAYDYTTSTVETFEAAHRSDYSPYPEELLVAELDVHQNSTRNIRMRLRDRDIQLIIANAQGSARICSVTLQGRPVGISGTRIT